jgi:hypothetical protein
LNYTYVNWPLGYLPSQDPVNGNPQGLTRMDNLYLDELGVLSLVRGIQRINPTTLADYPFTMYSKIINGATEAIWATLNETSTQIIRTAKGDFSDIVVVGEGNDFGAFGDALGEVICCAGIARIKDNTTVVNRLGLLTPSAPVVTNVSQPTLPLPGVWTQPTGTIKSSSANGIYGLSTTEGAQFIFLDTFFGVVNTTLIGGAVADIPGNDTIQFDITPDDPTNITAVRLEFLLGPSNLYQYDFDPTTLTGGPQATTTLVVNRSQFTRFGRVGFRSSGAGTLDWTEVSAAKVSVSANYQMNCAINNILITGGAQGQINGSYTYITVTVNDNGVYQAKSPPSLPTSAVSILNGSAIIEALIVEEQVNQVWIYRNGGTLDQYYRVGIATVIDNFVNPFTDNTSDTELLEIDLPLNPFLLTMVAGDPNSINDTIYCIEGLFYDRMLYMGIGFIYISDSLNIDAIDSRYIIKAFGDPTEQNLWIKKLTNNVCILGTNKNTYEITGTFQPLPDGTIDVTINPIGENHPPISRNVCASQSNIWYMAADGIRAMQGSNSTNFSPALRLLFEGENRGGIAPFYIGNADYPMTIGKTRFMVSIPSTDGTQRLFIYDLINNYWRMQYTNPISLFTTQTDRVLMGYNQFNGSTGGDVYLLDSGLGFTDNEDNFISGFPITFVTVFDANGQPRNRKDTFTMKLIVDTGGIACSVYIGKDEEGATYQFVGNFTTNGLTTVYFPLNNFTLGFRYSVKIVDNGNDVGGVFNAVLVTFKLYELTIEYEARPEQLDYMYIQPNNLGTVSRKRMVNFAFVIDTLGNTITFTPLIDNSNVGILPTSRQFSTPDKQTYIYYFTQEQIGTDINGVLSGGVFEFYGPNLQEIISEKMPVPCEYLVIPNNDYGTPDRKRHSSYKFQINTRGANVQFTPKLDGVFGTPTIYNTTEKRVVEYFFNSDTIARDIGGVLQSLVDGTPFEFYGTVTPQTVEKLPDRLLYYRIPNDNFGVAARKRVRAIPFVIDTGGQVVTFNPIVDQLDPNVTPANFQTFGKQTVLYTFSNDSFGLDYGGELIAQSDQPFEFYGMGKPEQVEILPVGKTFDQLGPVRFDKVGKIFTIRIRMIQMGNTMQEVTAFPFQLFGDASATIVTNIEPLYSGTFQTFPGVDYVYEIQLPKSINTDIFRMTLGPVQDPFCRYDCQIRVSMSGQESDSQWIPVK